MPVRVEALADTPPSIVSRFLSGDGVLWLGAGVSSETVVMEDGTTRQRGVPSARVLCATLNHKMGDDGSNNDLSDVASRFVNRFDRAALNQLLTEWYGRRDAEPPSFYRLLAQLPAEVRTFVTTNYDEFTEGALCFREPDVIVRERGFERASEAKTTVYKIHGDAHDPASCVITSGDYDSWEENSPLLADWLRTRFAQRTIVFVGYRAQDGHFRRMLRRVSFAVRANAGTPHTLYVVGPNPRAEDFAVYDEGLFDLALINATGEEFLEWLLRAFNGERDRREGQFLAQLIDSTRTFAAREALKVAAAAANDSGDWLRVAAEQVELAEALASDGRVYESLEVRAAAVDALRRGDDEGGAVEQLTLLFEVATGTLRDARAALRYAERVPAAEQLTGIAAPAAIRLLRAVGYAHALLWDAEGAEQVVNRLTSLAVEGDATTDRRRVVTVHELRGRAAVIRGEYGVASDEYGLAADAEEHATNTLQYRSRAALALGLGGDLDRALRALHEMEASVGASSTWSCAIGWVMALAGNEADGANAFRSAASLYVAQGDAHGAVRALRNAEWTERYSLAQLYRAEPDGRRAMRIERGRAGAVERQTVESLLREADSHLVNRMLRGAAQAAYAALSLAYDDVDPRGVQLARSRLGDIWLVAAAEENEPDSVSHAAYFLALAEFGTEKRRSEEQAKDLRGLLKRNPSLVPDIVAQLTTVPVGPFEQAGSLRMLGVLAPTLSSRAVSQAASAICVVLGNVSDEGRRSLAKDAALELVCALDRQFSSDEAVAIVAALTPLMRSAAARRDNEPVRALAHALQNAKLSDDDAAELAALMAELLPQWRGLYAVASVHGIWAALYAHAGADIRERLVANLQAETERAEWSALAQLAFLEVGVSRKHADEYLETKRKALDELLECDADSGGIGYGTSLGTWPQLAKWVARTASPELRDAVLERALRFIGDERYWRENRSDAFVLAGALALESETQRSSAVAVFSRIASGDFPQGQRFESVSSSPMAQVRHITGGMAKYRGHALHILSYLHRLSNRADQERVEGELVTALRDGEPAVRAAAARAIGDVLANGSRTRENGADAALSPLGLVRDLLHATRDHDESVRNAAIAVLSHDAD